MRKILIVEDDFYIRDIYTKIFDDAGFQVDQAEDGEIALQRISDQSYDIILLDIMLPRVSGIDVLKKIREPKSQAVKTPVYLLTNLGDDEKIKEAFKIGADGYLIKTEHNPDDVVKEINTFLQNR